MEERSYEDAAEEFENLSFHQTISRFAECFAILSHGELMALRSRFIQLAYLETDSEQGERNSAHHIAEALDEVIVFNLKHDPAGLDRYLKARNAEHDFVENYGVGTIAHDLLATEMNRQEVDKPSLKKSVFKWLSKK